MNKKDLKKMKKVKNREKEVKKKILARREFVRAPSVEANKNKKALKRVEKVKRLLSGVDNIPDDILANFDSKSLSAIEENARILRNLEAELLSERENKEALIKELEKAGCTTLEEKMKYLTKDNKPPTEEEFAAYVATLE